MKKQIVIASLASLCALSAQASVVVCNTNTKADPRLASTIISISKINGQLTAAEITQGGIAKIVTAPKYTPVEAKHSGPEVVSYINTEVGFQLTVNYQPIQGHMYGTLAVIVDGEMENTPVVCQVRAK